MAFTGFALPDIKDSDLSSDKERRQILEYLYQLTEQLRYVLSNIDEENLSDGLADTIGNTSEQTASLSREIADVSGNVSRVKQFADSLTLSVTNGTESSSISLVAGGIVLASQTIKFTGDIIFASDLTDGVTTISGSNIRTGTVAADRIDVDNLYAKHLQAADGTFTYLRGTQYINLADTMLIYPGYISTSGYISLGQKVTVDQSGITLLGATDTVRIFMNPPTASGGSEARWVSQSGGYYSLGIYTSARSEKKDISKIGDECSAIIDGLNPVYFRFKKDDADKNRSVGFIADETDAVCKEITSYSPDNTPVGVQYSNITALLVAEVKKLRARVQYLEEITA